MSHPLPSLGPEEGVRLWRDGAGQARANIRHRLKLASEDGFDFGADNDGARELALNILLDFGVGEHQALAMHRDFVAHFLLALPVAGGVEIAADDIHDWIELCLNDEMGTEVEEIGGAEWAEQLPDLSDFFERNARYFEERSAAAHPFA
jgi:hypothetical protein